uniref:Myb-like DNA-binding domain-containing protein n=1 Tax=Trepomonas sp. PC1 TaxID=1076344 RepID=A0A146KEQ8_9EUKA|eukprot:JAP94145.1 Myb-like DNA-binding domain-containing protein [Trepomonas sp. PC1]
MRQESVYHKWTQEELDLMAKGVHTYGHKWKAIQSRLLPHLQVQTIKNKYYAIQNKAEGAPNSASITTRKEQSVSSDIPNNFTYEEQEQIVAKLSELLGLI